MKILIVDDSRAIRSVIGRILENLGHESFEASNGVEALDVLKAEPDIECALVDRTMPVMDGLELIKVIRSDEELCELVLMMVTTEVEVARVLEALTCGADEYLMKPFTEEEFVSKLEMALSSR